MYSGKSRLKKNERINFLSSEVKFHSTEERKIERRRICFLKLKETIEDPQRNESITLEQHNLQTLLAIFRFNIHFSLSYTRIVISLLHHTLISPIQKKTRSHQQFSPCLPPPFNIQTARSGISSKQFLVETWVAVSGQGYIQGVKYALNTFQDIWNSLSWSASAHTHTHTYKLAYILGWSPQHANDQRCGTKFAITLL